jgi:integrase
MHTISEKEVAKLKTPATGNKVHFFSGASLQGKKAPAGFGVRVTSAGTKSFVLFHRADGRKHLETIGRWDENAGGGTLTVRDAIIRADKLAKDLKLGRREDARPARTRTREDGDKPEGLDVSGMLDMFMARYVEKEAKLRSGDQIKMIFDRLVKPRIGKLGIYDIRRSHVVAMLDKIADDSGPVMADRTLAHARKAFNWYAARDDEFTPPVVKGMARSKPKERERQRVLADDEIRDIWAALDTVKDAPSCYAPFIKTLLLTMARRTEAAGMHESEIDADGLWTIPGARYKTKMPHTVPLSAAARKVIGTPKQGSGFVFSSTGGELPFSGFSKAKDALDKELTRIRKKAGREPMENWTLHDLRRTGRSLMSRAGVPADHAERCLGHVIAGVRGVYDRFSYANEKRSAFEALATTVGGILDPKSNVVALRRS